VMHVLFKHAIRYEWIDRNPISLAGGIADTTEP